MFELPDRYEPTGAAADGGMGSVIVCTDQVLERRVAIKTIHTVTHRRRMLDEIAALLKMRSKHVVQVYDILQFDKHNFGIVQEFIDGQDLFESYKPPVSVSAYYRQLWQIASGIADIHAAGVIHRDIKPNNMKTDPEGVIKIFDFGLARDEGPDAATLGFVGTPGFAAPELDREKAHFSQAVDTYAFAASALYLATGALPAELIARPPKPAAGGYFIHSGLGLAPEIAAILDACLSVTQKNRPPMNDVRDVLAKHILSGQHQALVVFNGKASYLNADTRTVSLKLPSVGEVEIQYDGLDFRVTSCFGEVFINNRAVTIGDALPGSCVVTLGGPHRKANRAYITFDLSNPEIVV